MDARNARCWHPPEKTEDTSAPEHRLFAPGPGLAPTSCAFLSGSARKTAPSPRLASHSTDKETYPEIAATLIASPPKKPMEFVQGAARRRQHRPDTSTQPASQPPTWGGWKSGLQRTTT